jgi:hypothetical protein
MEIVILLSLLTIAFSDGSTYRASIDFCVDPVYYFQYDKSYAKNPNLTNCFQYSESTHSQDEIALSSN